MTAPEEKPRLFFEARLEVPRPMHELVCDYVIENLAGGVILEEEENSELVGIRFYVPEGRGESFKKGLARYIDGLSPEWRCLPGDIRTKVVADMEWEQAYRDSIKPVEIEDVVVRPPWVTGNYSNRIEIIIEPKMAFGTGNHETTRLCIKQIRRLFRPGQTLFDLGCGSGILAILAAKLGAAEVLGADIDLVAVANARENIEINGVTEKVHIVFGSLEKAEEKAPFDFMAANLIRSAIEEMYERMLAAVKPGGILLLSGLLPQDCQVIDGLIMAHPHQQYERHLDGQWLAYNIWKR